MASTKLLAVCILLGLCALARAQSRPNLDADVQSKVDQSHLCSKACLATIMGCPAFNHHCRAAEQQLMYPHACSDRRSMHTGRKRSHTRIRRIPRMLTTARSMQKSLMSHISRKAAKPLLLRSVHNHIFSLAGQRKAPLLVQGRAAFGLSVDQQAATSKQLWQQKFLSARTHADGDVLRWCCCWQPVWGQKSTAAEAATSSIGTSQSASSRSQTLK